MMFIAICMPRDWYFSESTHLYAKSILALLSSIVASGLIIYKLLLKRIKVSCKEEESLRRQFEWGFTIMLPCFSFAIAYFILTDKLFYFDSKAEFPSVIYLGSIIYLILLLMVATLTLIDIKNEEKTN